MTASLNTSLSLAAQTGLIFISSGNSSNVKTPLSLPTTGEYWFVSASKYSSA